MLPVMLNNPAVTTGSIRVIQPRRLTTLLRKKEKKKEKKRKKNAQLLCTHIGCWE